MSKPKFLLHACCANCAVYPLLLLSKVYEVSMYYYNPNIYPEIEYRKRLKFIKKISLIYKIPLITGKYEIKEWLVLTEPFINEPEGGKRCTECFKIRLSETASKAKKLKFDLFGTTLTISPHKNQEVINNIGQDIAKRLNIDFYKADFKKNDGFKNTMMMSHKLDIYRQNYCGCIYSIKKDKYL